jgi:membrane protease YdiL (CAAX protease family)
MNDPAISTLSLQILYPYIAVALTVLVTGLHHSVLKRRLGETVGMWLYFSVFFLLLLGLPTAVLFLVEPDPLSSLAGLGLALGDHRTGLWILLAGFPVSVLVGYIGSTRPEVRNWYPYSKDVCAGPTGMIAYEAGYFLLYYPAWEFLYRGLLFFPLVPMIGFLPAMSISTMLSTLHHIGFPKSEIAAALLGGVVFCAVAFYTQSVLYTVVLHGFMGVSLDAFICAGKSRRATRC